MSTMCFQNCKSLNLICMNPEPFCSLRLTQFKIIFAETKSSRQQIKGWALGGGISGSWKPYRAGSNLPLPHLSRLKDIAA